MSGSDEKHRIRDLERQLAAAQETIDALKRAATHRSEFPISEQVAIQKAMAHLQNRLEIKNRRIQQSEAKYRALFEQSPLGALTLDWQFHILEINKAGEELLGEPVESLVGRDFLSLFLEDSRGALEQGLRKEGELQMQSVLLDGRRVAGFRKDLPGGEGVQVLLRDVTAQVELDEKKMHAQKLEAVGQLAGGVAHDFNNLLTAIIGFAELLPIEKDPVVRESYIQQILETSDRASQLVARLLDFSRRGKIEIRAFNMHQVLDEVLLLAGRTLPPNVRIQREFGATRVDLEGDVSQWENAFLNLVLNAKDAMGRGGVLTIRTFEDDSGVGGASILGIEVSDTGEGIKEANLSRVFEPFFTTKERGKGTGLGLSAVYGTVKGHGGEIEVQSEPGKGTTFSIRLPV